MWDYSFLPPQDLLNYTEEEKKKKEEDINAKK